MYSVSRRDDGFALILAILTLGVLGLVTTSFIATLRPHLKATGASMARAEAESLADAGTNLAVLDLLASIQERRRLPRFAISGEVVVCHIGGARLEISIGDEAGRVDLNAADEALIQALLVGAGIETASARRATHAILDYRDADNDRRPEGAENEAYVSAGLTVGPKNAPFDSVEELGQVLGFDTALIGPLRRHVTVHSGLSGIDPRAAQPELLDMLLKGAGRAEVGAVSDSGTLRGAFRRALASHVSVSNQRRLSIRAVARQSGATFVREAVVELGSERGRPTYGFRLWRQGEDRIGAPAVRDPTPPPSC